MTLAARRTRNLAITGVAALLIIAVDRMWHLSLRDTSFLTGWLLLASFLFLALYTGRKKVPILPLIKVSFWLQAHIYVGLLAIVLFLLHVGFVIPRGPFEFALWLVSVLLLVSGLLGIYVSRTFPRRLRQHGELILFERIPQHRVNLAVQAEEIATRSLREAQASSIADFYANQLQPFFVGVQNVLPHLVGSQRPVNRLLEEIDHLHRYVRPAGREHLAALRNLVVAKDNLDHQYALQFFLKSWLFVHIPLTYCILLLAAVHLGVSYGYTAG
jgi:hypothetical protein